MSALQTFRHYTICQDRQGATVEVWRGPDEVACLAFDNKHRQFVELHISIAPPERSRNATSFQNLVQLAAPLRHRHLLSIIEGGEDEGSNYHISEFLDGERLDSWLARCQPLPPWLALLVTRQLVEGLAALASHPRLLAGVDIFHSGLTLAGPHPDDLTVKVSDLGFSGMLPVSSEPQFVEARAIHETGRLLLYMLTGTMTEDHLPAFSHSLSGPGHQNLPPELGFLLDTIFQATQPHHPRTLEQLRTLTERCVQDLSSELTARPEILPPAFRPRLPLAPHLPGGTESAEILGNDFTLDTRAPDAADPYRYRGTERATRRPVNVQLLPPPHLLPSPFLLPDLENAWSTLGSTRVPPLLALLAFHPEGATPFLVEELPGKYSLDTLRRLRGPLQPAEVLLILTQIAAAATAAESRNLPLHWRSPRLIPLQFTGPGGEENLPPPDQLARLPLTEWPAFTLKFRTWPIALNFTQPERFNLERLLPRDPALMGDSSRPAGIPEGSTAPTARDLALLATWLLGGSSQVKENLKPLLYATISARGPTLPGWRDFIDRFQHRLTSSGSPVPESKSKSKAQLKNTSIPGLAIQPANPSAYTRTSAAAEAADSLPPEEHSIFALSPADLGPDPEAASLGFAEALFGPSPDRSPSPHETIWPLWPAPGSDEEFAVNYHPEVPPEGAPLGFMEAAGQPIPPYADAEDVYGPEDEEAASQKSASRWTLFLVVVLIAAALAALMAQLSGQAIWLR
jgi:hypothetical protein